MSLKEKIVGDMKSAMKAKEVERLSVIRMVKAKIMNEEIDKGGELSDEDVTKLINTLVKQRRDSAEQYTNANRPELAKKELDEITVLEIYLPIAATPEEIENAIDEAISETGATSKKDMGIVIKTAMSKLSGLTVDGKAVSEAVKLKLD